MCGIAGYIAKKEISEERKKEFIKATDLLSHRGPDYKGIYEKDNLVLVHHRLSIIDLDARSNQPFHSQSEKFVTVYNGEIYNFKELKRKYDLKTQTSSDTEVMLEGFEMHGEKCLTGLERDLCNGYI